MATRRPNIHPEHLADIAATARQFGRFVVQTRPESITPAKYLAPILGAAETCRLFKVPKRGRNDNQSDASSAAVEKWTSDFLVKRGTAVYVKLDSFNVRRDVAFWRWLTETDWSAVLTIPTPRINEDALFLPADGPTFRSFKYSLTSSALNYAKREARARGRFVVSPAVYENQVSLGVIAQPAEVARLAQAAYIREPRTAELAELFSLSPTLIMGSFGSIKYWMSLGDSCDEAALERAFEQAERKKSDASLRLRALIAAEIVASIEGRLRDGSSDDDFAKWAKRQQPLSAETISLASRAVALVRPLEAAGKPRFRTREARADWAKELAGLGARLAAAARTRSVRESAPNAVSVALPLRSTPERWSSVPFYALSGDALALLEHIASETAATFYGATADGGVAPFCERWEWKTQLINGLRGGMNSRRISQPLGIAGGLQILVSWPDVSPPLAVVPRVIPDIDPEEKLEQDEFNARFGIPPDDRTLETVGWGYCAITLMGASRQRILRSSFEYPTGSELRGRRYRGKGPWTDVDWTVLRRRVRLVRNALFGTLPNGRLLPEKPPVPVLAHALKRVRQGRHLASRWAAVNVELTADWRG
jgi:hypothetical protein